MIRQLIVKIRRKPKAVRDQIALGIAGSFTVIVFLIWAYHLPERMSGMGDESNPDEKGVISQFIDNVNKQVSAVKESTAVKSDDNEEKPTETQNNLESYFASSTEYQVTATSSVSEVSSSSPVLPISTGNTAETNQVEREVRIITTNPSASSSTTTNQ